jgi:DNA-binding transcriptional MerR regulator
MSKTKSFMSIGDVLQTLKEEFPDVTISKIRFLESEGLVEPERTPKGYRKFYSGDLARLRYILRLQRDQFMPLKVIRRRLEHFDPSDAAADNGQDPAGASIEGAVVASRPAAEPALDEEDFAAASGLHLSFEELVSSSGLAAEQVADLEEFGLIDPHEMEGGVYYDEDDLLVARIAKDFSKYGIEPRHIRMYRNFAEREAGLFEQIVLPLGRVSGDGRRQVTQSLAELAKLSKRLKHLLLKASLREHLRS